MVSFSVNYSNSKALNVICILVALIFISPDLASLWSFRLLPDTSIWLLPGVWVRVHTCMFLLQTTEPTLAD